MIRQKQRAVTRDYLQGDYMRLMKVLLIAVFALSVCITSVLALQQTSGNARLFEGARLLTGDGSAAIENSAFVIVAATKTSAGILKLDNLGTVANGKSADFVVLDANPLDDIKNTRRISKVYLRGKEVDRAALRKAFAQ
jgi:cytosine/adenosine deaminase-related metal-dependent hydrolase